ncbi:MAG: DNRLRE domain-containing protein, partial [Bacillota bacterium]|nr:DNRLRE domain-containing protein [Bacillota bacterium]
MAWIVLVAFMLQAVPVMAIESPPIFPTSSSEVAENDFLEESPENSMPPENVADDLQESPTNEAISPDDAIDEEEENETPQEENPILGEDSPLSSMGNEMVLQGEEPQREIDGELEELREPAVKYFLNDDKTITAATYPYEVHFENDEGKLVDIDNSLADSADEEVGGVLENSNNAVKVKFSKKAKENNMVKLESNGYKIFWGMINADKNKDVKDKTQRKFNLTEDPLLLENMTSTVSYQEIRPNVDLFYDVVGTTLKERIVLNSADSERSFQFHFRTKELTAIQQEGSILLNAPNGETIYAMDPMYMYDASMEGSNEVEVSLETVKDNPNNHEYILTVTASSAWLNNANRVYPVTIDPTITLKKNTYAIYDGHVNSDSAGSNYQSSVSRVIGQNSAGSSYTYVKFKLPNDITDSDRVIGATLALCPDPNNSYSIFASTISQNPYLCAYETLTDWNDANLTWNNKPSFDSEMIDYDKVDSASRWYTWDITKILNGKGLKNANGVYLDDGTYGVTLKGLDGETSNKRSYFCSSKNTAGSSAYPFLQVTYLSMIGLEDYWTYHSQEAGLAGNGYINDFTGSLTAVFNDVSLDSERMPLSISHVYSSYNSAETRPSLNVGSGWRLSIQESVMKKTI